MGSEHDFCRGLLSAIRRDLGDKAPKGRLSAMSTGFRGHYLVENGEGLAEEAEGCCKWAAMVEALSSFIAKETPDGE